MFGVYTPREYAEEYVGRDDLIMGRLVGALQAIKRSDVYANYGHQGRLAPSQVRAKPSLTS